VAAINGDVGEAGEEIPFPPGGLSWVFFENPAKTSHIPGYRTEFLHLLVLGLDSIKPDAEPMRLPVTSHQSPVTARTRFLPCPPRAFVVSRSRSTSALHVPARSMKLSCLSISVFAASLFCRGKQNR
jgi:hypothetical protein